MIPPAAEYDCVVVGGGISGVGAAMAAARRGLRTVVVERACLLSATSANSLRIIHGGFRYLKQGNLARLLESSRELDYWVREAPQFIKPFPFLMPLANSGLSCPWIVKAACGLYRALAGGRLCGPCKVIGTKEIEKFELEGKFFPCGALLWHDALVDDLEGFHEYLRRRLLESGAEILENCEARALNQGGGHSVDIEVQGHDELRVIKGKTAVLVRGPWESGSTSGHAPKWCKSFNIVLESLLARKAGLVFPGTMGRALVMVPRAGRSVIGTWYEEIPGAEVSPIPSRAEVTRLIDGWNQAAPFLPINLQMVRSLDCGVLPMQAQRQGAALPAGQYRLRRQGRVVAVLSTKYTTFRSQGEKALGMLRDYHHQGN